MRFLTQNPSRDDSIPKGDELEMTVLWIILIVVAVAGLFWVFSRRRSKV